MPPRNPLTTEQRAASASPSDRLLVVASPGCGKTTVAAERYGTHRFEPGSDARRCLALSFTRAATRELEHRIRSRWGPAALAWPNRAMTLDALHVELLHGLLRSEKIRWRSGHTALRVEDSWRGQRGVRRVASGGYAAVPVLRNGIVQVASVRHHGIPVTRIGAVADLRAHFDDGRCTHLEVREVLSLAMRDPKLSGALEDIMRSTTRVLVIDEIFDGNDVDIGLVTLAARQGLAVSLVGDPWQAVYEFRGADPAATLRDLAANGFAPQPVTASFRFRTATMRTHSTQLRAGAATSIDTGSAEDCDVVLASEWEALWACDACVLPLSFGTVRNQTDAALLVLLDHVVDARLSRRAVYTADAHAFLKTAGLVNDGDLREAAATFVRTLPPAAHVSAADLDSWRASLRAVGVPVQLRRLRSDQEASQVERLRALAQRLAEPASVAGMTVHQAKGGEWPTVGLRVSPDEARRLARGLRQAAEADRVLYVAATRAMDSVRLV